jgi:crossover junction endodeoxyribonuclease RuvC
MRILGIDPGSNATGYGVVEGSGSSLRHLTHGVLRPPTGRDPADRLAYLHGEISRIVAEVRPEICVIEQVFVASSPRSALVLGQARGVALAALAGGDVPVREVSARAVKKAVVGTGAANKSQVQAMVKRLLGLEESPPSDASDALAIAISLAHAGKLLDLGVMGGRGRQRSKNRAHFAQKALAQKAPR